MHTTVAAITRICTSPVEIGGQYGEEDKKVVIQPGMKMVIPIHEIQMLEFYHDLIKLFIIIFNNFINFRDPQNFPNPEQFDPSRFSKENQENIKKMSFLAFGEGPRLCLGKVFGVFQVKTCIVSVLSKYRVELSDKMTEPPKQSPKSFTLHCDTGVWLKLIPRKWNNVS